MIRIIVKSSNITLFIGFIIGFILGILLIPKTIRPIITEKENVDVNDEINYRENIFVKYSNWLDYNNYKRYYFNPDITSYKLNKTEETEAEFLKKKINILCCVFIQQLNKIETISQTWGKHCNKIIYFYNKNNKLLISIDNIFVINNTKSSWEYLCRAMRYIWLEHTNNLQWIVFLPDTIFFIVENLRLYLSTLDYKDPYYLGHALRLWGDEYNTAKAGYVLSYSALTNLLYKFNSTQICFTTGKYWKNEDYYLGKYLADIGVYPTDTRDHLKRGRFHGYNLNQLLFSRTLSPLSSYWKNSVYPVSEGKECCSNTLITFHGIEEDKIQQFYYLLYRVKRFVDKSIYGNIPPPTPIPDQDVWKHFLFNEGLIKSLDQEITNEQFFELTKNKIMPPHEFNKEIRKQYQPDYVD